MWDFSWLERRWSGAGYEDWARALDELSERGYNAVRIDAYPHLIDANPEATHELKPVWGVHAWGAPMRCEVQVMPALTEFIAACGERDIKVGLSSWYRRDSRELWRKLFSPKRHAESWIRTLDLIKSEGLAKHLLYLDLCNEWPLRVWAPFFYGTDTDAAAVVGDGHTPWQDDSSLRWTHQAVELVRKAYPELPITVSMHPWRGPVEAFEALDFLDFYEPHIWMSGGEFYHRVGYTFQHKFDNSEYENVQKYAKALYSKDKSYWHARLHAMMDTAIEPARKYGKPLMTTECWGITDYKDGPGLDWGWVKESCAEGVRYAAKSGCWVATATSNFCGPQFVGMWRDVEWHQRQTSLIRSANVSVPVPDNLQRTLAS